MSRLRQRHPETKQFILYLDNARYQHARAVREWVEAQKEKGTEFVLDFLPAYSPNLNLIERLWKFLRKHALQQWHPSYEAMQAAVARVLDHLQEYHEELTTLMAERFHLLPERPAEAVPVWGSLRQGLFRSRRMQSSTEGLADHGVTECAHFLPPGIGRAVPVYQELPERPESPQYTTAVFRSVY